MGSTCLSAEIVRYAACNPQYEDLFSSHPTYQYSPEDIRRKVHFPSSAGFAAMLSGGRTQPSRLLKGCRQDEINTRLPACNSSALQQKLFRLFDDLTSSFKNKKQICMQINFFIALQYYSKLFCCFFSEQVHRLDIPRSKYCATARCS